MDNKPVKDVTVDIKEALAVYLGVGDEDINDEDSLTEDLHMRVTDLTDFVEQLKEKGVATHEADLSRVETVGELVEELIEQ